MNVSSKFSYIDTFSKKYELISALLSSVSAICILLMILSTTIDTTSRYLFNNPIPGMFELNEVLLVVCVFMGISWTQIKRAHIRVEVFVLKFSTKNRHILNIIAWVIALFFVGLMCQQSFYGFLDSYRVREFRWGSIQMPIWWAKGLIPVGFFMLMIQLLLDILMEFKLINDMRKEDPEKPVFREF